jgi:Sigma-70, region 4
MASQNSRSVMRALAAVPLEQRQALELAFFAGLSHSEIADMSSTAIWSLRTTPCQRVIRPVVLVGIIRPLLLQLGAVHWLSRTIIIDGVHVH